MKQNLKNRNKKLEEKTGNMGLNTVNSRTQILNIYIYISIYKNMAIVLINRGHLEIESDYQNWAVIFDKCDPKNKNIDTN